MKLNEFRIAVALAGIICTVGLAQDKFSSVPGVVIAHSPRVSGIYLGAPGIVLIDKDTYLVKYQEFGPKSSEWQSGITNVFRSDNAGKTWRQVYRFDGLFWASIFACGDAVYMMGVNKHHGDIIIARSADQGDTWTEPKDVYSGLLLEGEYHTAPVPVLIHKGRIWRTMEDATGGTQWGLRYRAFMMSAPVGADLLSASNWTSSNRVGGDKGWLAGQFGGWLEGNAVLTPKGEVVNILRVDVPRNEKAAVIRINDNGMAATFDPDRDFIDFPGGAKKFTIRYDSESRRYWALTNHVPDKHQGQKHAAAIRNTVALAASTDLQNWTIHSILLYHPDIEMHAFQYLDWMFEGEDIVAVSRTACDDGLGGAKNFHDANFVTFHRFKNFRRPFRNYQLIE